MTGIRTTTPPSVLVAFASRHGSTQQIAGVIARRLQEAGLTATVRAATFVADISAFDAVVLGSAVYMGRWLTEARDFVRIHQSELRARPTWLFSSGPLGNPPRPEEETDEAVSFATDIAAIGHRRFAGRLDRKVLSFAERAATRLVGAEEGDFRDWEDIRRWTDEIAAHLPVLQPTG